MSKTSIPPHSDKLWLVTTVEGHLPFYVLATSAADAEEYARQYDVRAHDNLRRVVPSLPPGRFTAKVARDAGDFNPKHLVTHLASMWGLWTARGVVKELRKHRIAALIGRVCPQCQTSATPADALVLLEHTDDDIGTCPTCRWQEEA